MIPWELLDSVATPGADEPLRLFRRGEEFSIRIGREELMNSRAHSSEEELARLACVATESLEPRRILVGGLGMGFTLAAVLRNVGAESTVEVAELAPAVIEWNRGPLGPLAGHPLRDRRVVVHECAVEERIFEGRASYAAILLDVDNGPEGLVRELNDGLYGVPGLRSAWRALRHEGVLAVWSASPDEGFRGRLRGVGFSVRTTPVRSRGDRGARHTIWVARR